MNPIAHIPHYELNGRILFHKARHRDNAARLIDLPDSPVRRMVEHVRTPRTFGAKWHWKDSRHTFHRYKAWSKWTRTRAVDGQVFDSIPLEDRCDECNKEFLSA